MVQKFLNMSLVLGVWELAGAALLFVLIIIGAAWKRGFSFKQSSSMSMSVGKTIEEKLAMTLYDETPEEENNGPSAMFVGYLAVPPNGYLLDKDKKVLVPYRNCERHVTVPFLPGTQYLVNTCKIDHGPNLALMVFLHSIVVEQVIVSGKVLEWASLQKDPIMKWEADTPAALYQQLRDAGLSHLFEDIMRTFSLPLSFEESVVDTFYYPAS